jgi:hypothetical protein
MCIAACKMTVSLCKRGAVLVCSERNILRLPRSTATAFGRWLRLAIFLKAEAQVLSEAEIYQYSTFAEFMLHQAVHSLF